MDKRDLASQLLAHFGNTLTVGVLTLSPETNSCVLVFDENIVLNIEFDPHSERLVLSCYLGELPRENAEPLLRELMGANLYWHRTRGATLCLEEGTGGVILTYPCSVTELDGPAFERVVENFVNQCENWSRRVAAGGAKADAAPGIDFSGPASYA